MPAKYPIKRKIGRPRKGERGEDAFALLLQSAPFAADYIYQLVTSARMKTSSIRFEASKFVLEQVLGKARFKLELPAGSGGVTINMLVQLAQQQGLKQPDNPVTSVKQVLQSDKVPLLIEGIETDNT